MNPLEDVIVLCPSCGEPIALTCDCTAGDQDYIEDCPICCRPMHVQIAIDDDGLPLVSCAPAE